MAHHYVEPRRPSPELDEEENEERSRFRESSNRLLTEDRALQSYPSTKSSYEMLVLTISLAGLQSAYCSQFADGTDFLMEIGISPTVIASVWIIPPVCGAILQPLFGILSDTLKEKVGRREPFVLVGGIGLLCALLIQAWSSTIANSFDSSCEGTWPACRIKIFVSVLTVVVLYARVVSLTSVLYYILSYGLPPLGTIELRMQELALISSIIIVVAISIPCVASFQTPPHYSTSRALPTKNRIKHMSYIQQLKETVTTRMIKILAVQFLSSFAWFPYLFYISSNGDRAKRLGPLALFLQSVVHLTTSLALPFLVSHTTRKANSTIVAFKFPTLPPMRIWRLSQALYSVCVAAILLTNSTGFMLALAALTGLCWAVMQIIPYTMLTDEFILGNDEGHRRSSRSGLFLGINNLSLTIPQIIAGLICTTIFSTVSNGDTNSLFNGMTRSLAVGSFVSLLAAAVSFCI
ncbi:hypothetical protein F4824DRAFT_509025 [Ustulina deusta]|nr:hypothetical protein F4824DRAFT_509025 [Ustulina deusta]